MVRDAERKLSVMPRASNDSWFRRRHGPAHAQPSPSHDGATIGERAVVPTTGGIQPFARTFPASAGVGHLSGQPGRPGGSGQTPQYHWHQDTHYHYTLSDAAQPARQGTQLQPPLPLPPALSRSGGCLVVFLVLLGAVLTFLVMLMGLALASQVLTLR